MSENEAGREFDKIVGSNYQAVYRYAFRLCGSVADAEDLTQKTFLIAQGNVGQLRNVGRVKSWLFAILRNCFLRDRQRRRPVMETDVRLNIDHFGVEVECESDVDSELLQAALNEMSDISRMILIMFYFEECSYLEIAKALSLPIGTVMSRLARAKAKLRSIIFSSKRLVRQ